MSSVDPAIQHAAAELRAGRPVVLPTDTVYGIAVDPSCPGATARLFAVKGRPPTVPLPVLAADTEQAFGLCGEVPEEARLLAAAFWPGALTLVLARRRDLDHDLGGTNDGTIGVRVPDHPVARELTRLVGPLATTSANLHGCPTPETAAGVVEALDGAVGAVVDGGPCAGAPSTVVRCVAGRAEVLREGRIGRAAIDAALARA